MPINRNAKELPECQEVKSLPIGRGAEELPDCPLELIICMEVERSIANRFRLLYKLLSYNA